MGKDKYSVLFIGVGRDKIKSTAWSTIIHLLEKYPLLGELYLLDIEDVAKDAAKDIRREIQDRRQDLGFRRKDFSYSYIGNGGEYATLDELLDKSPPDVTVISLQIPSPEIEGIDRRLVAINTNLVPVMDYGMVYSRHDYKGFVLVVTNPVDMLSYAFASTSRLDVHQIGGFNSPDVYRFHEVLEKYLRGEVDEHIIEELQKSAFIIGPHEDRLSVPVVSELERVYSGVRDILIKKLKATDKKDLLDKIEEEIKALKEERTKDKDVGHTATMSGRLCADAIDLIGRSKLPGFDPSTENPTFSACYSDSNMLDHAHYPLPLFIGVKAVVDNLRIRADESFMSRLSEEERKEERRLFDDGRARLRTRLAQLANGSLVEKDKDGKSHIILNTKDDNYKVPRIRPAEIGIAQKKPRPSVELSNETSYEVLVPAKRELYRIYTGRKSSGGISLPDESAQSVLPFMHQGARYIALGYRNGVKFVEVESEKSTFGYIDNPARGKEARPGFNHLAFSFEEDNNNNMVFASHHILGVYSFNLEDVVAKLDKPEVGPNKQYVQVSTERIYLPIAATPIGFSHSNLKPANELIAAEGNVINVYQRDGTKTQVAEVSSPISSMVVGEVKQKQGSAFVLYAATVEGRIYSFDGNTLEEIFAFKEPKDIAQMTATTIHGEPHLLFNALFPDGARIRKVLVRSVYDMYNPHLDIDEYARSFAAEGSVAYLRHGVGNDDCILAYDILTRQPLNERIPVPKGYTIAIAKT